MSNGYVNKKRIKTLIVTIWNLYKDLEDKEDIDKYTSIQYNYKLLAFECVQTFWENISYLLFRALIVGEWALYCKSFT